MEKERMYYDEYYLCFPSEIASYLNSRFYIVLLKKLLPVFTVAAETNSFSASELTWRWISEYRYYLRLQREISEQVEFKLHLDRKILKFHSGHEMNFTTKALTPPISMIYYCTTKKLYVARMNI